MELRQLKHFVAVGEAGSITAAARVLRLTQPALSRQIKALEEELETVLLARSAHSISLTQAGEVLLVEARKLLKMSELMIEKVKTSAVGEPLRVGYAPSLAGEFLSLAIERFTQFHPRVRVSLWDCSSSEMRAGLAGGKLDLIVAAPCQHISEPIHWTRLRDYGWRVVMLAEHPLGKKSLLSAKDLAGQRLLLYDREQYPDYWDRVTGFFREHHLQAKVAGEFDGVSSLVAALEGNLGIALLAESSQIDGGQRQRLISRPLTVEPERIQVAAGVPAQQSAGLHILAFIEELRKSAEESQP
jgi:LysR family transcriptional regulator, benzoate and cis,cis-muconate-responsive activator of ben and cat genes